MGFPTGAVVSRARTSRDIEALLRTSPLTRFVHLSTVTAYGAREVGRDPLTEDSPLQPAPGWDDAVEHVECERILRSFARQRPEVGVVVLRAALGAHDPLFRPLVRTRIGVRGSEPARQFLHEDDLERAIEWAVHAAPPGTYNIAPSGTTDAATVARTTRRRWKLRLPVDAARRVLRRLSWVSADSLPPGAIDYLARSFIVDTTRAAAAGFEPLAGNEEALVHELEVLGGRRIEPAIPVAAGLAGVAVAGWLWSRRRADRSQ